MIHVDGRDWGTDQQLAKALGPDITPAMIRRWRERHALTTIHGYSPYDEAARIEHTTRTTTRGRPRQLDATMAAA